LFLKTLVSKGVTAISPTIFDHYIMNNKEETSYAYFDGTVENTEQKKTDITFDVNLKAGAIILRHYVIWLSYNIPTPTGHYEYRETTYTGSLSGFQGGIGVKF